MESDLFKLEGGKPTLLGTACAVCSHQWFPAINFGCERCGAHGADLVPCEFEGIGKIHSWVEVPEGESRFVLATVQLQEGPVVGGIIEDQGQLAIGNRVEAFGIKIDGKDVIRFRRHDG